MPALATVAAVVGIGSSLAGTGMSISQMVKAGNMQREADRKAREAMHRARMQLETNQLAGLSIAKEPYTMQREYLLNTSAQVMDAGRESTRGAGATAGLVLANAMKQEEVIRAQQSREMAELNKLKAKEDSRLQGLKYDLELAEVEGAQKASANYWALQQQATQNAIAGIGQAAEQLYKTAPLFDKKTPDEVDDGNVSAAARDYFGANLPSDFASLNQSLAAAPSPDWTKAQQEMLPDEMTVPTQTLQQQPLLAPQPQPLLTPQQQQLLQYLFGLTPVRLKESLGK